MKTKLDLLMAVVVLPFSVGWVNYAQKESARWDYTVIHTYADTESQLNSLGAAGWQLVSVTEAPTGNPGQGLVTLYLKPAK
jgi:hypothetical protein